jgi:hypothetical protein
MLSKENYILLKNEFTKKEIKNFKSSINDNLVNYKNMKDFIDKIYMKKLEKRFQWAPKYIKFKYNKTVDSETLHGTLYNFTNEQYIPIYTGFLYLDKTKIEIVPETVVKNEKSTFELYNSKQIIKINVGDLLIFNECMHYRDLYCNKRVLQIFQIYPNKESFDKFHSKLISVGINNNFINKSYYNYTVLYIINLLKYYLVTNNLQYKLFLSDIKDEDKEGKIVSYINGLIGKIEENKYQEMNINITNIDYNIVKPTNENKRNFLFLLLVFLILFFLHKNNI